MLAAGGSRYSKAVDPSQGSGAVVEVRNLSVAYPSGSGLFLAAQSIDFEIRRGKTLGLVGESGSGKTTIGLAMLGLIPKPGRLISGHVLFKGEDLARLSPEEHRRLRGDRIAVVFQNPMSSLNPSLTVGRQILEVLEAHRDVHKLAARERALELLNLVGVPDPSRRLKSYPHELSGGMRQRVMIAMAVALEPDLLIADEPTTALDVTIQAQILALIEELQDRIGMAVLYITHNLAVAASICHEIAVCYAGRLVERAPTERLFSSAAHPYTRALIEAVPHANWREHRMGSLSMLPPRSVEPSCAYASRCPWVFDHCLLNAPELIPLSLGHDVRCFKYQRGLLPDEPPNGD